MKYAINLAVLDEFGEDPYIERLTDSNNMVKDDEWWYWLFLGLMIVIPRFICVIILTINLKTHEYIFFVFLLNYNCKQNFIYDFCLFFLKFIHF